MSESGDARATAIVPPELDGVRADRILAVLGGISRAVAGELIDAGMVTVSGEVVARSSRLDHGALLAYPPPRPAPPLAPEEIGFGIAYLDPDVIVVDKPAGLVVHPGAGNLSGTLANGLLGRFPELGELGPEHRWGLVHRLDRDTSGLLLVARTAAAHRYLQAELKLRRIRRRYLALTAGSPGAATGTIDAPIGRSVSHPTRMAVVAGGRHARTHYRRLAEWEDVCLVEVSLETGRTHQIRVHFASIGSALVGDGTYGSGRVLPGDPGRVWLHASELAFPHPRTRAETVVRSALPVELRESLARLGAPVSGEVPDGGTEPENDADR
jgi:23S rRNA pseudouridine1911/1915/1917 synthase